MGKINLRKIPIWAFFLFFVVVIFSLILTVAVSIGVFKKVHIYEDTWGGRYALYIKHLGAYHKIDESVNKVKNWALANDVDCKLTFGQYLDDPNQTLQEELESYAGCLVDKELNLDETEFEIKYFDKNKAVMVDFEGSPAIGPLKVYPKILDYIQQNNLEMTSPPIEVYSEEIDWNFKIKYVFFVKD